MRSFGINSACVIANLKMNMNKFEKCFFLDVGQGNSSVILTPDNRAIIVDAGPVKQGVLWNFLASIDIKKIECVILSHNDNDHIRGFAKIAETYGAMIGSVFILRDRLDRSGTYDAFMSLAKRGIIPRPKRAEVRDLTEEFTVFENERVKLDLLYPDFLANESGVVSGDTNRTSVIAKLACKGRAAVIFPGDSTIESWRDIAGNSRALPIDVEILVMPHHGGAIGSSSEEVDWFLESAVRPRFAIMSVGSGNGYGHPNTDTLERLRTKQVHVICTEITPHCHAEVASLNPGVLRGTLPYSRSANIADITHIGCAGTVVAELREDRTRIIRVNKHRSQIREKVATPKCLNITDGYR